MKRVLQKGSKLVKGVHVSKVRKIVDGSDRGMDRSVLGETPVLSKRQTKEMFNNQLLQ